MEIAMKNKNSKLFRMLRVYVGIFLLFPVLSSGNLYGETVTDVAVAGQIEIKTSQGIVGATARQNVSTGFLYDKVVPFSKIHRYSGRADSGRMNLKRWRQIFFEMRKSAVDEPLLPALKSVKAAARQKYRAKKVYSIGLLDLKYNALKEEAVLRELSRSRQKAALSVPQFLADDFDEKEVFAASLLKSSTWRGKDMTFVLDPSFYFSNREKAFTGIRLDLDDGKGPREVSFDREISTSYKATGEKTILLTAIEPDGSELTSRFTLDVQALETPDPHDTWVIQSDMSYLGGSASGEAYIYRAEGHAELQNPVVLVEGFDMLNDIGWDELFGYLNAENLLENLRGQGYDLVLLNFDNSMDYIQRNAYLLVKLIERINTEKSGDSPLVIVGASMGGLVARYALAYMELNGLDHETRTFISFDAPHQGANIPLGIQHWLAFFAGQSAEAEELLGILDSETSPAARQMLVYHHLQTTGSGQAAPDPLQAVINEELEALGGYPQNLRKVAFANGRGDGNGLGFDPGDQMIDYEYSSFLANITGNVWAVPDNLPETMIFDGRIIFTTESVYVSGTRSYDNAPGGTRNTNEQLADSDTGANGEIIALQPNHCFVPTVSALDIDTTDLFYNIADDALILEKTPFDVIYFSAENSEHMSVTAENAPWFLEEVEYRGEPVDISGVIKALQVMAEIEVEIGDINEIDGNQNGRVDVGDVILGLQRAAYIR